MLLGTLLRPLKPTLITTRPEPKQVQFKGKRKVAERKAKAKGGASTAAPAAAPAAAQLAASSSFVTLKGVGAAGGSATSVYIGTVEERSLT